MNDELKKHLDNLYEVVRQNKDTITFTEEKKEDLQKYLGENDFIHTDDYEKFFENLIAGGESLFNPMARILYIVALIKYPEALQSYNYVHNLYWMMQEIKF